MKVHSKTKQILLSLAVSLLVSSFLINNSLSSEEKSQLAQKLEDITVKRASKTQDGINFCLTVIPGDKTHKTFAIVTMTNMSDQEIIVPTPYVMPLAGTLGHKNTIQITNENGDKIEMTGPHFDSAERATTKFPSFPGLLDMYTKSWLVELEKIFPDLAEPGQYIIDFRLISEPSEYNKATWKGTVDLSVTINKSGPYKIEPQPNNR